MALMLRPTSQHNVNRPAQASAGVRDHVVAYADGDTGLSAPETVSLCLWIDRGLRREPGALLVMGCTAEGEEETRVQRLQQLRELIRSHGIDADRIRYTTEPIRVEPARLGSARRGGALLRLLSPRQAERQVRSIHTLLQPAVARTAATAS